MSQKKERKKKDPEERKLTDESIEQHLGKHIDPKAFAETITRQKASSLILGVDPGNSCGFAYGFVSRDKVWYPGAGSSGILDLKLGAHDSSAIRSIRLLSFLHAIKPDLIIVEGSPGGKIASAVSFQGSTSLHSWFLLESIRTIITLYAETEGVACESVGVTQLKRFATGGGVASKADMILAANKRFGVSLSASNNGDDNVADAIFMCAHGIDTYGEAFKTLPKKKEDACPIPSSKTSSSPTQPKRKVKVQVSSESHFSTPAKKLRKVVLRKPTS